MAVVKGAAWAVAAVEAGVAADVDQAVAGVASDAVPVAMAATPFNMKTIFLTSESFN
jgi:hypothetical protein